MGLSMYMFPINQPIPDQQTAVAYDFSDFGELSALTKQTVDLQLKLKIEDPDLSDLITFNHTVQWKDGITIIMVPYHYPLKGNMVSLRFIRNDLIGREMVDVYLDQNRVEYIIGDATVIEEVPLSPDEIMELLKTAGKSFKTTIDRQKEIEDIWRLANKLPGKFRDAFWSFENYNPPAECNKFQVGKTFIWFEYKTLSRLKIPGEKKGTAKKSTSESENKVDIWYYYLKDENGNVFRLRGNNPTGISPDTFRSYNFQMNNANYISLGSYSDDIGFQENSYNETITNLLSLLDSVIAANKDQQ